jgi:CAAX protease family protein
MRNDAREYRVTLLSLWVVLSAIGYIYSIQQHIPTRLTIFFLLAALVEIAFYLMPGFGWTRGAIERIEPPPIRALVLAISAILPYLIYSLGTGTFHIRYFGLLAILVSVCAGWYVFNERRGVWVDLLFLLYMAGVFLSGAFNRIYVELASKAPAQLLGHLMWIRLGIFAVLSIREMGGIGFGFLPAREDCIIGLEQFALFLPAAVLVAWLVGALRPHVWSGIWWKDVVYAIGTFLGIFWVVALSEEFFFRGMLQQILSAKFRSRILGLVGASVLFGLAHLWFGHRFPNWRQAALAAVLGLFCGIAYIRAGNIRAAMITHACAVTVWSLFLR